MSVETVSQAGASVLVVEDDPVNRTLLQRLLERDGHRVITAADGRAGLDVLRREPVDVVLLDILMPEVDGYTVLGRMQADERLCLIPVIVISALEEMSIVVRCIAMGAEDYLPKPFDPVLLRARISGCLAKKRLRDLERRYLEEQHRRVRDLFARFVPEPVVDEVLASTGEDLRLGGQRRMATVLFGDLRGFTSFAETRLPELVIEVLNRYLTAMSDVILQQGGTLICYLGDGIMAVFGAPIEQADHADRAVAAARAMTGEALERFNDELASAGVGAAFRMGVGVNSGVVMAGNVGSQRRLEYAAVGDTTNTAARLEAMTKETPHMALISDSTRAMLTRSAPDLVEVDTVRLRGRRGELRLWGIEGALPAAAG